MKIKECLKSELFSSINTAFKNYAAARDIEKYPNVNIFPDAAIAMFTYSHDFGSLVASDMMLDYKKEEITAEIITSLFKLKYFRNWLAYYDLEVASYNPLWNVEGTETRTITNEQLTDGHTNTAHGKVETSAQTADGHTNTTHGKTQTSEQVDNGITSVQEYGYNSSSPADTSKTTVDGGKTKLTDGGTTNTSTSAGTVTVTDSGTTNVNTSIGKTKSVDEFVRGGNIGVTKTTEMFVDQMDLLSRWNFINAIFTDINKEFTELIWEVE